MRLVTLDFETYYDGDYSLSKMTTEEYVNDSRFQIIGFGARDEDGRKVWITGNDEYIEKKIRQLKWDDVGLIAHNTRFDGAILAWRFGLRPSMWFDTLSMARPFHNANVGVSLAKLAAFYEVGTKGTEVSNARGKRREDFTKSELQAFGNYCMNDCELTWRLFSIFTEKLPAKELKLIDLTLRMYLYPRLRLDPVLLQREIELDQQKKKALVAKLADLDLGPKSLTSSNQFAKVLLDLGVEPPTKVSPKTGERTWAFAKTDADFVALKDHDDPLVAAAVEARLGSKSTQKQTRTTRFLGIHQRMKGWLPVPLGYYNAHTGRYGGEEKINLQNLQRTDPKGNPDIGLLRRAIVAPEGHSLVVADYSQIEARMLAWLAQQRDKVKAFADKRDVYSEQASVIYGRHIDRRKNPATDFIPGFIGKAVVLGCGYGLGYLKFAGMIYVGMLGMKGILFDENYVDALSVDVSRWMTKKQLRGDEWERILSARPILLTDEQWIIHCAVADKIIRVFRETNPQIGALWEQCGVALQAMLDGDFYEFGGPTKKLLHTEGKAIALPNGMLLRYEGLDRNQKGDFSFLRRKEGRIQRVKTYGGSVTENIIQALARIPTTNLMLKMDDVGMNVVLQAHDEIGAVVPDEDADLALEWTLQQMAKVPKWAAGLPLGAEGGIGKRYGDIQK